MKLLEIYNELKEAEAKAAQARLEREEREEREKRSKLLNEFETQFAPELPMLAEAGIDYHANFDKHGAGCIFFSTGRRNVQMDFHSAKSYRYYSDENPYFIRQENACYGDWDKEGFVVFIVENLLKDSDSDSDYLQIGIDNEEFEARPL